MTTQTMNTIGHTTQNSKNAGTISGITFARHISTTVPVVIHNSHTASNSPTNDQNPIGDREPEDDGNDDGPGDPFDPSEDSDHPNEENVQHNLADAIAKIGRAHV